MAFVTRSGKQLQLGGKPFRFIGGNYYPLCYTSTLWTQSQLDTFFQGAVKDGISVIRTWLYNNSSPATFGLGNFQYLTYSSAGGTNLISNPGFETGTSGWALDSDFARSSAEAHDGSYSVKQTSTGGYNNLTTANDGIGIAVTANTDYTLTYWYNLSVTSGFGPIVNIVVGGSPYDTTIASGFPGDTNNQWVQGQITFNPGSNTAVWIRIYNNNGNVTGYWDSFAILSPTNIVENPGFESGSTDWGLDSDYTVSTTNPHSGTYSVAQNSNGSFNNLTTINNGIGLAVSQNTNYQFTFWYNLSVTSGFAPIVGVATGGSPYGTVLTSLSVSGTQGQWFQGQLTFNSGSNTAVWIRIYNNGGVVTGYWDDFSISPQGTSAISSVEPSRQNVDLVLARARVAGVKLMLSFFDWNSGTHIRDDYCRWSDAIYGTNYIAGTTVTLSSLTGDGTTATATTASPHGLNEGELVTIAGATPSSFNGNPMITSTTATTFTYNSSGSGTATGSITAQRAANSFQAFYVDPNIQQFYQNYVASWINRVNTVNGQTYGSDDTIFSWELGNECRFDQSNDPYINGSSSINLALLGGSGGWIDTMSAFIKSIDTNHLVGATDLSHTTDYVTGDIIHNGTYYGVDFTTTGSLSHVDYFEIHLYPYQGDGTHLQQYGTAVIGNSSPSMQGLRSQVDKFIQIAHAANKPMLVTEWGVVKTTVSNDLYTNYPRDTHFQKTVDEFFASGGDGFIAWHYYGQFGPGDNNYGIQSNGPYPTSSPYNVLPPGNQSDMKMISYFRAKNKLLQGQRPLMDDITSGLPGL